jgi:hypothetical protein
MNVISTGVFTSADVYLVQGAFAITTNNMFQGTMWILKNSVLGTGATLGTASYQVYDKAGNAVSGMSQSGIVADANGQFKITAVASNLNQTLDHYLVKISITMDSAVRTGYEALIEPIPEYKVDGAFSIDSSNQLNATFWASANEEAVTNVARLGTASYQVYDKNGTIIPALTQSGLSPDSNGLYHITPVASSLSSDLTHYVVKTSINVDGILRTTYLPIIGGTPDYAVMGAFVVNSTNQFQGTIWALKNSVLAVSPGANMGTASYTVYDRNGSAVGGLSQSGITVSGNGQYIITPVTSPLNESMDHYLVKVTVNVDGVDRTSYVSLIEDKPEYEINGVANLDDTNTLQGSFWMSQDEKMVTSGLGTGSYQVYTANGTVVGSLSQSGIVANGNGVYVITPVALPPSVDPKSSYAIKITITANGVQRSDFIPIQQGVKDYGVRAVFSINASNQLQGTFWGMVDDIKADQSILDTASYIIYDKDGIAVGGLTETGITADSNGLFKTTPVSAILLTDLTHYTAKITINIAGSDRVSFKSFTLLGN